MEHRLVSWCALQEARWLVRYCSAPHCTALVPSGRCAKHQKAKQQDYDDRRGTAHQRGYTARWARHRQHFLDEQFRLNVPRAGLCGARLPGAAMTQDSECQTSGLITLGQVADHILPVSGPNDPTFYVLTALQWLCAPCHDKKRQRERHAFAAKP